MDIKEMEEQGISDNYLELKKYISEFLDNNYRLSKEDMKSIISGNPTENVVKRNETSEILNMALEDVLQKAIDRNNTLISEAENGNFTPYTTSDFENEIYWQKQEMLQILYDKKQELETKKILDEAPIEEYDDIPDDETELEEQNVQKIDEQSINDIVQEEQDIDSRTDEQLIDDIVQEGQDISLRTDEINSANREINQAEIEYINMQEQMNNDMYIGDM